MDSTSTNPRPRARRTFELTKGYGRTTVRLPFLIHWVAFAWVRSSRTSARRMYAKTLWRWQLGRVVVMVLPRRRRAPR
jgi:hypothetical protein